MQGRRLLAGWLAVAATAGLAGCGEAAERDFCTQYDQLAQQADQLRGLDVRTAPPESVRSEAAELRTQLDELQAVADGNLDFAVSALRTALDDLRVAAIDVAGDASDVARPLLQDSLDEVRQAWAVLRTSAAAQCGND